MHWACAAGALRTLVLRLGVDINQCDAKKYRSPLLVATQNGHPLLVLFCVRNGADVTLVDDDGDTAVHWAAYKGATQIVEVFQYLQSGSVLLHSAQCGGPSANLSASHITGNARQTQFYSATISMECSNLVFLYRTVMIVSGSAPNDKDTNKESASARAQRECMERPLCYTCHIQRPARSKYCRICNPVFPAFDQDCLFVDNCVGRDYYATFLFFAVDLVDFASTMV
ncbi:unnamed protein product [Peronospora farinosa]|uniref:Palmitoyltransferase n=1 Tax=Peronospora farinosa TaxID=134698 RepID=A0AAV0T3C9_9STRA|nr:unnamed protein product [Peronospora farinosa]